MYADYLVDIEVPLPRAALRRMARLVRTTYRISNLEPYRRQVLAESPDIVGFDPGHDSVMMGYDFHLDSETPKLIEINTNAGGGLLAFLSHLPEPLREELDPDHPLFRRIRRTFAQEWERFCGRADQPLRGLAIVDEDPVNQFLGQEMQGFARLLEPMAQQVWIAEPSEFHLRGDQLYRDDTPIDLIYNRHCDFYLESESMAAIRHAYLAGTLCLSPNPRSYGLLGDKERLCFLGNEASLEPLPLTDSERDNLLELIPRTERLDRTDRDEAWKRRKKLVFKPTSQFGSLGVFVGAKMTKGRFDELDPSQTLIQQYVPPSRVTLTSGEEMKVDYRLFVYRDRILGVTARLYRGQVTNMRTPGGGFAPVHLA